MKDKIILIYLFIYIKLKAFLGMKMYTFISKIYVKSNSSHNYSVIVNVFNQFSLQNWVAFTRRISCLSWNFTFTSFVFSIMKVLLWKIAFTLQICISQIFQSFMKCYRRLWFKNSSGLFIPRRILERVQPFLHFFPQVMIL